MLLAPRYDGPTVLSIDGDPSDQLAPICRQHRRMQATLAELSADQWATHSRCEGWSVRDVASHLIDVNSFWRASVLAGLAGNPTRFLASFDPAATPPLLVERMSSLTTDDVLDQFVTTSEAFLAVLEGLTEREWSTLAESPAGHVPVRLVTGHALWDSWIHERDIIIPLDIDPVVEDDEVRSCLRYAAAVSPVLGFGVGRSVAGTFAVHATNPEMRFVLDIGDGVSVREATVEGAPCLEGDAVSLIESLSLRAPLPASAPRVWMQAIGGLQTVFDASERSNLRN